MLLGYTSCKSTCLSKKFDLAYKTILPPCERVGEGSGYGPSLVPRLHPARISLPVQRTESDPRWGWFGVWNCDYSSDLVLNYV